MDGSKNLKDLLDEQLVFVEKVLEYNKEIAKFVKHAEATAVPPTAVPPTAVPPTPVPPIPMPPAPATQSPAASPITQTGSVKPKLIKQNSLLSQTSASAASDPAEEISCFGGICGDLATLAQEPPAVVRSEQSRPLLQRGASNITDTTEASTGGGAGGFGILNYLFGEACARRKKPLFPNADEMKENVKKQIAKEHYDVEDYYHKKGFFQALARNDTFKNFTFLVIFFNTFWIAIDTDYNPSDDKIPPPSDRPALPPVVFQVVDNFLCAYFSFEIIVRFKAFKRKQRAFQDGWFVFDFFLVVFMVWETWVTPIIVLLAGDMTDSGGISQIFRVFRLFRLTRVARLGRLLNTFPELMVLIKGLSMAVRSTFSTFVLMFLIVYVFAILFTQLLSASTVGKGKFETVPMSMDFLMRQGVFPDQSDIIGDMLAEHWAYYMSIVIYLLLGSLTVMNMLIGVICEVVNTVSEVEGEEMLVGNVQEKIQKLLPELDSDHDGMVSDKEFKKMLELPTVVRNLHEVGVDVVALVDFADFIFTDNDFLSIPDFVETVLQFRGSNNATVKDIVDIRKYLAKELQELEGRLVR